MAEILGEEKLSYDDFLGVLEDVYKRQAQLVSAPDCGSGGRGFESHYPPCYFAYFS